jgi:C1A family cysteine protease
MIQRLGANRDVHDVRDHMFAMPPVAVTCPPHVDLRPWGGPVKDQGNEGSCTGHAFSSAREWMNRRYHGGSVILSPQSLYVDELIREGDFPNDDGAMSRTGCWVLQKRGCCEARLWPYVAGQITAPTPEQIQNAAQYKTAGYHRLAFLNDILTVLSLPKPWPVTVGFSVYESFMTQQVADTGIMPIPTPGEAYEGGHEVLCLGYDWPSQMGIMQNSWSDAWGQKGYFMMPFEVLTAPDTDLWVSHM